MLRLQRPACVFILACLWSKCLWNVVPDEHTDTTGLTFKLSSSLILIFGLLKYTILLCVHFESLHPDVWWVKINFDLCFIDLLSPKVFDFCVWEQSSLHLVVLLCLGEWVRDIQNIWAFIASFYDPNTLLLFWMCFVLSFSMRSSFI